LTAVSAGILVFASAASRIPTTSNVKNPGTGLGAFLTLLAIGVLGFNIYWAVRYIMVGRRLTLPPGARPNKAETIRLLRIGLIASLAGMLLALLGQGAILGVLAEKVFAVNPAAGVPFGGINPNQIAQPLDILVVQASFNVILAQFIGISASLWLLNQMNRQ
jgi:hypothetical protein